MKLILTCEHAGNKIPVSYKINFQKDKQALQSHRGYDPGAYDLYRSLTSLADFKAYHLESRLLIEVNRSLHHHALFSEFTQYLSSSEKNNLIHLYYLPYRHPIEAAIREYIKLGEEVYHLSIHSFTPELAGKVRDTDIGLLYDPAQKKEKEFSKRFKKHLKQSDLDIKVRFNYPYLGKSDGFTSYLRKKFPKHYSGIELEVNQKYVIDNKMEKNLKLSILTALQYCLK